MSQENQIPSEGAGVKVGVAFARLIKWENNEDGTPDYSKPPIEVLETPGPDQPMVTVFKREVDNGSNERG